MKKLIVLRILGLIILSINSTGRASSSKIVIDSNGAAYLPMGRFINLQTIEQEKEMRKILKYSPQDKTLSLDYNIADTNNCYIDNLSIEPTSTKIAFTSSCVILGGTRTKTEDIYYKLTVLDSTTKKIIISFDYGHLFSFSPKGDAIVYAEDIYGERGFSAPPGYQGVMWIYDFNTKTKKKMIPPYVGATDINWSEHEGNIYVDNNGQVYCYDSKSGKGNRVAYQGIFFSSDGKYYVSTSFEDSSRIFRTSDNMEMKEWEKLIIGQEIGEAGKPPYMF